jgi:uncharacterized protein YbjT (DUF2867 family)
VLVSAHRPPPVIPAGYATAKEHAEAAFLALPHGCVLRPGLISGSEAPIANAATGALTLGHDAIMAMLGAVGRGPRDLPECLQGPRPVSVGAVALATADAVAGARAGIVTSAEISHREESTPTSQSF